MRRAVELPYRRARIALESTQLRPLGVLPPGVSGAVLGAVLREGTGVLITTEYFDALLVAAAKAHVASGDFSGPLYGSKVGLFAANVNPTKRTGVADLTEADYPGYAKVALTWGTASRDNTGAIDMPSNLATFVPTDATTPTQVYGYFITDSGGTHLLAAEKFDSPVNQNDTLDALGLVLHFRGSNGNVGSADIVR